ncbi:HEAT repeat domain-containing protein [Candidatus Nitrospira bockiana]
MTATMPEATAPASPTANQPGASPDAAEFQAIKQLLALLDKTFKTVRTYGPNNPVAQKFFQQFYNYLSIQLAAQDVLQFLVQRSELYYKGEVVYRSSSPTENLAFKLHADGIRELSLHEGLSQEDLLYFLDAVWGTYDQEASDDDIVTRLWEKNLSTISFVTAEEIVKADTTVLEPQDSQLFTRPVSALTEVAAQESARKKDEETTLGGGQAQGQGSVAVYEVSPEEMQKLAEEIQAESSRDNITYLLDMLTAILASEQSHVVLDRLLGLFTDILETLTKAGNWKLLNMFVNLLHEAQELCPNLSEEHKSKLGQLFDSLGRPDRLRAIEGALNANAASPTEDLHALLLMLSPAAAPSLCMLMANLKHKVHRMMVCEVLATHAKANPLVLVKGLNDSRWYVVRNLVYIMGKVGGEHLLKHLEPLVRHPDTRVRKEVLRTMKAVSPSGKVDPFVAFLNDPEESVRLSALKIVSAGEYKTAFKTWVPIVTSPSFADRSVSEKRALFHAMRLASGDENVPYWRQLVTRRAWRNRKLHEETAVLAAEALGALGTADAVEALRAGRKRFNRAIRRACETALGAAAAQPDVKAP